MERVAIVAAVRTPIGRFLGAFADLSAADLGVFATKAAIERARIDASDIDELIYGNARQAGGGPNPARQVLVRSGIPNERPAFTVNQACGSGIQSIILGADRIRAGKSRFVLAGGTESMSRVPHLLDRARTGYRLGNAPLVDGMYRDGFLDPICGMLMGETAEKLADMHTISREEQDQYALESQRKAGAAIAAKRFDDEIAPVTVKGRKGEERQVTADEHPRPETTLAEIGKLPPVFREGGTVHAGNSSGITDGAASLVLAAESVVKERKLNVIAYVGESEVVGVDPSIMGIGPVPATRQLLTRTKRKLEDFDLIELNEAFAAQVLACDRELHLDRTKLNVNGGAIALGHPIGCTGARIVTTLIHEMKRRQAARGLATLCVSGGLGIALELNQGGSGR
ncbi:MAG TPA: acetyl-CoA C-acetyltransferase [Candidatus Saccharimonadales bacterium]|nr:acetyl-CoA C-acetyltransferase [Candidatus Saccharimonadales bacterium]